MNVQITACTKCKNDWGLRHYFDLQVEGGKVYDLRYQGCPECGYETKGTRKYLGLESEVWPDYEPCGSLAPCCVTGGACDVVRTGHHAYLCGILEV